MASISPNEAQVSDVKRKKEREKKLQTTLAWLGHAGRGREREEGCGLGGHVSLLKIRIVGTIEGFSFLSYACNQNHLFCRVKVKFQAQKRVNCKPPFSTLLFFLLRFPFSSFLLCPLFLFSSSQGRELLRTSKLRTYELPVLDWRWNRFSAEPSLRESHQSHQYS